MKNKIERLENNLAFSKCVCILLGVLLVVSLLLNVYLVHELNSDENGKETADVSDESELFEMPDKALDYNLADCVKSLGKYKDLEVFIDEDNVQTVTVEEYADYVLSELETTYEVPKGDKTEYGDLIDLQIRGTIDGVDFDGGSMNLPDYQIGEESYFTGFDDYLVDITVGSNKAKTFEVELPEDFDPFNGENPEDDGEESDTVDLAGKLAKFEVAVSSAERSITYDCETVTDDILAANTTYSTVEEFMEYCEDFVKGYNDYYDKQARRSALLNEIIADSEVEIPDEYLQQELAIYILQYTNIYATYYDSLEEYLETEEGITYEEFLTESEERLKSTVTNLAVSLKLAEVEGIEITDQGIQDYIVDLVEGSYYEGSEPEEIYDLYKTKYMTGEDFIKRMALSTKVLDELLEFQTFVSENSN